MDRAMLGGETGIDSINRDVSPEDVSDRGGQPRCFGSHGDTRIDAVVARHRDHGRDVWDGGDANRDQSSNGSPRQA